MVYPEKAKLDIWLDIWFPFKLSMCCTFLLERDYSFLTDPHATNTAGKDKEGHLLAEVTLSCAVLSSSVLAKRSECKLLSCAQLFVTPWINLTSKTKTWKLTKLILFERQFRNPLLLLKHILGSSHLLISRSLSVILSTNGIDKHYLFFLQYSCVYVLSHV